MSRGQSTALRGGDAVFILTLTGFAGQSWAIATEPVEIASAPEGSRLYTSGLTVSGFSEQIEKSKGNPNANGISLKVDLGADLARLRKRGHRLEHAFGELAMVTVSRSGPRYGVPIADQAWNDRFRFFTGRPVSPEIAPVGLPLTLAAFTLLAEGSTEGATLLDPDARVTTATWPNAPSASLGTPYTLVFGAPGAYNTESGAATTTSGSPAVVVEETSGSADTLLLCDGHAVSATVVIFDGSTNETFNVTKTSDSEGRPVSVADVSGAGTISRTAGSYWVGWHASGGEGGHQNPYGDGVLRGAGDVARFVCARSSNGVDHAAWAAVSPALNARKIDGYVSDDAVSPMAWLVANITKVCAVEVHGGPDGLRPYLYDPTVPLALAPELVADAMVQRISPITSRNTVADLINRVTVNYAIRDRTKTFRRTITIGPNRSSARDHTNRICEQSFVDYGTIATKTISADLVYDEATAEAIAATEIRIGALLRDTVVYRLPPYMAGFGVGLLVRLTDAGIYLDQAPALIVEREWDGREWVLTLELIQESALAPYGAAA